MAHAAGRFIRIALVGVLAYHISTVARDEAQGDDTKGTRPHTATSTSLGRRIVAEAKAQRGVPYSWGGGGPSGKSRGICCSPGGYDGRKTIGFDCSGLVQYAVYRASKGRITMPRVADEQVHRGKPVTRNSMRPGDLIGFDHGQGVTHIGIYIGDGRMVHAPQTGDVVKISSLASRKDQRWTIRRLR
ncbi:NLP/P60 protein [Mycobacterium tuberculosis]|nr:NLP/P60 protein [Mycobacterium tuberculosis]